MRTSHQLSFALLLWTLGCRAAATDPGGALQVTRLQGTVLRGPITPVCMPDRPCDAPFSARFHVLQSAREVAQFTSDDWGRLAVALPPGQYTIVPDAAAPIMSPSSQARGVTVSAEGVTSVRLEFDTGIR